ncbi:MAG: hypothetical protein RL114_464 [Actinomycetota bacterium]|jgi:hypothetical protein
MRYLSLEWMEAMQANVAASESLTQLASTNRIGVTQVVTDGPEGTVVYHLQVGDGVAEFGPGPASDEQVRMEQSWQTAVDVATETVPAQEVFMKGLVKISGDPQSIMDNVAVFAALDTAFAAVRGVTEYR